MTDQTGFDDTLDPRSARPNPLDAENARKKDVQGGNEDGEPPWDEENNDPDDEEEEEDLVLRIRTTD